MDPLANLLSVLDESENEETQEPKKGKKKKKLTPAQAKKLQAKLAEEAKQLLIKQRQEYLRETKARVNSEWEKNFEKAQIYESEFERRLSQLKFSFKRLIEIETSWKEHVKEVIKNDEWLQYLKCDGLPNPSSIPEINTYIYEWTELDTNTSMSYFLKKMDDVMKLLSGLNEYIIDPGPNWSPGYVDELKSLRKTLRQLLDERIDAATFVLCSRIESDMESINVTTSKYFATGQYFDMSLWAELITPIPSSRVKEIRQPMRIVLEDTNLEITIPVSLLDVHKVIRTMWLKFDHYSDLSRTYNCPPVPNYFQQNLLDLFLSQNIVKIEIMNERTKQEQKMKKKIAAMPVEPTLSQELLVWESEPQRALSEEIAFREWKIEQTLGEQVLHSLEDYEVNLRERTILGDLLLVQVLYQPSQPKHLRYKHSVTLRSEPPMLHVVDFYAKLPFEKSGTEEGPSEGKTMRTRSSRVAAKQHEEEEEQLKKLVTVQLRPSPTVLWFEHPSIARWDKARMYWSTEDIYSTVYDEDVNIITCKIRRLGVIGIHVSRYCNFPFQDWIFEPGETGEIHFYLKTSKAEFHFKIRETEVCLESMSGVPSKAMNWILGIYYPPSRLRKALKKGGIDIFPEPDAGSYVDEIRTKHIVVEKNVYQVWALFSQSFRFKRSKFDQVAGREHIIFQAQEIYKNHQVDFCLVKVSMGSCYVLDIKEDNDEYSPEPAPYMESFADLYNLLIRNCTMRAKRQSDVTSYLLVQTVQDFLGSVRPLSFCLR